VLLFGLESHFVFIGARRFDRVKLT
jgi:hypothetical protein